MARTESKPCSTLSKKTFSDGFLPPGRRRWGDEESTEGKRFGTFPEIHRTTGAASSVAVGLLAWSVLTKFTWSPQWQAASIPWDTGCSFWGVQARPFRLSSITEAWGQRRHGKGCTSKAEWSGPACCLCLVMTYLVTHNFCSRITTQWSQLLRIIFPTHFGCSLFTKNAALLILLQNSVHLWILPPFLSCQALGEIKHINNQHFVSNQCKSFMDWLFAEHLHCLWRQSMGTSSRALGGLLHFYCLVHLGSLCLAHHSSNPFLPPVWPFLIWTACGTHFFHKNAQREKYYLRKIWNKERPWRMRKKWCLFLI